MPKKKKTSSEILQEQRVKGNAILRDGVAAFSRAQSVNIEDVIQIGLNIGVSFQGLKQDVRQQTITSLINKADDLRDKSGAALAMLLIGSLITGWTASDTTANREIIE